MLWYSTILRELVQSLAKVTLLLKHSVKLRRCILCGDVAACCETAYVLFVVQTGAGYRPATSWVRYTTSCNTRSSAPEDGQNNCPKYVELTGIINKPLLLHLDGCLYYLYFIIFFGELLNNLNLFLYKMSCIS